MSVETRVQLEVIQNGFVARRLDDDFSWATGSIGADIDRSSDAQVGLMLTTLDTVVRVRPKEQMATSCTDGRWPDTLENGEPMPVRPQVTGCMIGLGYYVMNGLGLVPDTKDAAEAVMWTGGEVRHMGFVPNAHCGCMACAEFATVSENAVRFDEMPAFRERQRITTPRETFNQDKKVYDEGVQRQIMDTQREQLASGDRHSGLTLDTFLQVARELGGAAAVGSYVDDGRGVHGHVEGAVVRLDSHEYAIDSRALNETGNQVFGTNDDVLHRLAQRIAFFQQDDGLYLPALQLANTFTNAAHGTLVAPGTPTWQVKSRRD